MTVSDRTTVLTRSNWTLAGIELLVAASAIYGGVGLMADAIGMPDEWLAGTPFRSWVLPGMLLLAVVAVPMMVAAVMELNRSPWAGVGSVIAGSAQIGWIAGQLLIMQRYNVLQPVMITIGLAVVLIGVAVRRHEPFWPGGR